MARARFVHGEGSLNVAETRLCWTAHRIMMASSAERMLIAADRINMEIVAVAAVAETFCVIISGVVAGQCGWGKMDSLPLSLSLFVCVFAHLAQFTH